MMRLKIAVQCLLFALLSSVSSSTICAQGASISIESEKDLTLREVFDLVKDQTDYNFIYKSDMFKNSSKITLTAGDNLIKDILNNKQLTENFIVKISADKTIVITAKNSIVEEFTISGRVTDSSGIPLIGATASVSESGLGTITDIDGSYSLSGVKKGDILSFSYLGFMSQDIVVQKADNVNVVLIEASNELNEVTIYAGYYNTKRATSTGNIEKVSAAEIQSQPLTDPIGSIQGRMAGVEIQKVSSVPGSGFSIQIRGDNSFRGGQPLYIVDGTPLNTTNFTLDDGLVGQQILPNGISPLQGINPENIESIEVLKDADATAIYGSRGADGVVLITTKKGKAGKTVVDVNMYTGTNSLTRKREFLNTEQHLEVRREAFANDQAFDMANGFPETEINPGGDLDLDGTFAEDKYTDWQEYFLGNTGKIDNMQLSVSGGSERTQFRVGGGYSKETPTLPGNDGGFLGDPNKFEKISFDYSINHSSANNKFKIGMNASYVNTEANYPISTFISAVGSLPNRNDLLDSEGNLQFDGPNSFNPLEDLQNDYTSKNNNLVAGVNLSYELLPGLKLRSNVGYTISNYLSRRSLRESTSNPLFGSTSANSTVRENNTKATSYNIEPQLDYNTNLGIGVISVLVGVTYNKRNTEATSLFAQNFADDIFIDDIGSAAQFTLNRASRPYAYAAYYGRIGYNIDDKYIINLSGRRDGSSRFGPNNRFSNFGSIGAAWVFSEENFIKDSKAISFGKLRASYGRTGSDNIGDFRYLALYTGTTGTYSGVQGKVPEGLPNSNFSWEGVNKFELGLSLGFLRDRINVDMSFYRNRTTNQLIQQPLPSTTGFSGIQINLPAVIQNRGFEFVLNTRNIRTDNFSWSTSFNVTIPQNQLLEFPELESNNFFRNSLVIGESINVSRLYEYNGVDPQTGQYTFTDFNGNEMIDFVGIGDAQKLVNPDVNLFGGLTNTLSYKKFDASFTFQFVKKEGALVTNSAVLGPTGGIPIELLDRWQNPGDITDVQRLSTNGGNQIELAQLNSLKFGSDGFWGDRSFLRLQNLSLSYNIPKNITKLFSARLYLQAQNLLTITKYNGWDPDIGQPLYKTITFGGQFQF